MVARNPEPVECETSTIDCKLQRHVSGRDVGSLLAPPRFYRQICLAGDLGYLESYVVS